MYITNSDDKIKLACYTPPPLPHQHSTALPLHPFDPWEWLSSHSSLQYYCELNIKVMVMRIMKIITN